MNLESLSPDVLEKIKSYRWDDIIEKHEGPFNYGSFSRFSKPEFMRLDDFHVLLPVDREHHANISVLRCIQSADSNTLTIFLKDSTYVSSAANEFFEAGYVAVCDKFPGENFYITILYHEWFMVDNS
jgi:hypothetical protein